MLIKKFIQTDKEITTNLTRRTLNKKETLIEKLSKFQTDFIPSSTYPSKNSNSKKLIGQMLVESGLITNEQLTEALSAQQNSKFIKKLGQVLIEMGFVSKERLLDFLSTQIDAIIKEYEALNPKLVTNTISQASPTIEKRVFLFLPEEKIEIEKRIYMGQKKLEIARTLVKKGNYSEAINKIFQSVHHANQAAQFLPIDKTISYQREILTKSVYTGHTGTGNVQKNQVIKMSLLENNSTNINTKKDAAVLLNKAEKYISYIENLAKQKI